MIKYIKQRNECSILQENFSNVASNFKLTSCKHVNPMCWSRNSRSIAMLLMSRSNVISGNVYLGLYSLKKCRLTGVETSNRFNLYTNETVPSWWVEVRFRIKGSLSSLRKHFNYLAHLSIAKSKEWKQSSRLLKENKYKYGLCGYSDSHHNDKTVMRPSSLYNWSS